MQNTLPTHDGSAGRRDIFDFPEDDSGLTTDQHIGQVSCKLSILALFNQFMIVAQSNLSYSLLNIDLVFEHQVKVPHTTVVQNHLVIRKQQGGLLRPKDQRLVTRAMTRAMTRIRRREN
jgi:hypothetical protein